uniref:peptidyl-tRNA hydrolase n=1 Tax=Tanacetum cinerariifolium TaxID=118510 RepID=A0A6L2JBC7_TANCI|nr:peptidyl-tRNA hydrolase, chloroplastic [Tanacetum cinerariifolium]
MCTSSSSTETERNVHAPVAGVQASVKQYPWLIVGLGNPGKLYHRTRHNVGFEMVDAIAEAEDISMKSVSYKAFFGKGSIGNIPLLLAKPQTFMNVSGESVGAIVSFYKIPPKQVLVIYDDLDLPFGKLRMLPKGGHGGHNGMKSVINHLKGSRDFPRLRIGIGRPPGKMEAASYVLRRFSKQESEELDFTFKTGIEAVRILLLQGSAVIVTASPSFISAESTRFAFPSLLVNDAYFHQVFRHHGNTFMTLIHDTVLQIFISNEDLDVIRVPIHERKEEEPFYEHSKSKNVEMVETQIVLFEIDKTHKHILKNIDNNTHTKMSSATSLRSPFISPPLKLASSSSHSHFHLVSLKSSTKQQPRYPHLIRAELDQNTVVAVAVGVVSVAFGIGVPIFYESQIDNAKEENE